MLKLLHHPGAEDERRGSNGIAYRSGVHPFPGINFVWGGRNRHFARRDPRHKHWAYFPLDDAGGIGGAVGEFGEDELGVEKRIGCDAEFLVEASPHGILGCFPRAGVPAGGVGPYAGPGLFPECAAGDQYATAIVNKVAGEGEMQRGVGRVHGVFRRGAAGCTVGAGQDDKLGFAHGVQA